MSTILKINRECEPIMINCCLRIIDGKFVLSKEDKVNACIFETYIGTACGEIVVELQGDNVEAPIAPVAAVAPAAVAPAAVESIHKPPHLTTCHEACYEIAVHNGGQRKGAGLSIIRKSTNETLLAKKKDEGKFVPCSGKSEESCYIRTALREAFEELGLELTEEDFDNYFKKVSGEINYVMIQTTPIFIGEIPDLNIDELNATIARNCNDASLGDQYKEMELLKWFDLSLALTEPNTTIAPASEFTSFTKNVMKKTIGYLAGDPNTYIISKPCRFGKWCRNMQHCKFNHECVFGDECTYFALGKCKWIH